jgi:prevent-host-death family protein
MAVELITVAALRARLADIIRQLESSQRPVYVTQRGEAKAVLVGVESYHALVEQIEYLHDSLTVLEAKERRESGRERTRPWSAVKRSLRGRVPA